MCVPFYRAPVFCQVTSRSALLGRARLCRRCVWAQTSYLQFRSSAQLTSMCEPGRRLIGLSGFTTRLSNCWTLSNKQQHQCCPANHLGWLSNEHEIPSIDSIQSKFQSKSKSQSQSRSNPNLKSQITSPIQVQPISIPETKPIGPTLNCSLEIN